MFKLLSSLPNVVLQRGARYIVLTSRRGRKFFEESSTVPSRQKLCYMESREDLILRVAACNATSTEATSDLLRTLEKPLGGCFSMTLVLSDALFLNQTDESFRSARDSKFNVSRVFEAATPIEKLDFFVQFSSIASLSGNYGQSNYSM
jgi:KR domain